MVSEPNCPIEVFFSYSHKDQELRDKLETHLSLLKRQGYISSWHDRKIGAGEEWAGKIDAHLNTAKLILLLVSADFIASDYCYGVEMKRVMQRHDAREARVIPIILRPTDWKDMPLGILQALPTDGRPITSRSWRNQDEAFFDVEIGIKKVVKELTEFTEPIVSPEKSGVDQKTEYKVMKAPGQSHLINPIQNAQKILIVPPCFETLGMDANTGRRFLMQQIQADVA